MKRAHNTGFSIIEMVVVVAVVSLIGFLGYTFYSKQQTKVASTTPVATVPAAPEINSAADLTTAEKALDSTANANSHDSAQLDSELANF